MTLRRASTFAYEWLHKGAKSRAFEIGQENERW